MYSGGWNTEHVWNLNGRGTLGFPMVDKMAVILLLDHWKTELQNIRYYNLYSDLAGMSFCYWTIGKQNFRTLGYV